MAASDVGASANPAITETLAKLGTDPKTGLNPGKLQEPLLWFLGERTLDRLLSAWPGKQRLLQRSRTRPASIARQPRDTDFVAESSLSEERRRDDVSRGSATIPYIAGAASRSRCDQAPGSRQESGRMFR
jgi:hypothetical protein